jgi:hypothetical protein
MRERVTGVAGFIGGQGMRALPAQGDWTDAGRRAEDAISE